MKRQDIEEKTKELLKDIIESGNYKEEAKTYPIKAWYLYDEPDVHNLSRENLIYLID